MQGAVLPSMSRNASFGKFSSTVNTLRIDSPDIGGMAPRPNRRQSMQSVLRGVGALFALLAMSLFAASVAMTNASFTNLLGNGDWTDGLAIAPSVLALILNPVFIFLSMRAPGSPAPAVRAAADFIIWGLAIPSLVYAIAGGMFWNYSDAVPEANGTVDCSFWYNSFSTQCAPTVHQIGNMQITGAVFLVLLCVTHLALCISDVAEILTHREKRMSVVPPDFEMSVGGKNADSRPVTS